MKMILVLALVAVAAPASAQTYVNGYTRSDGTYVAPHYRSSPNSSTYDNYSTRGNTNPYTGRSGTVSPYSSYSTPRYRAPSSSYSSPYSGYGSSYNSSDSGSDY